MNRLLGLALLLQGDRQVVMGHDVLRIHRQCVAVTGYRLVEKTLLLQDVAKVVVKSGSVRFQADRLEKA